MTLQGSARKPINVKVFQEQIEKTERIYFEWHKTYDWLIDDYKCLQDELAKCSEKIPKPDTKKHVTKPKWNLKPFPETVNQVYGWISTKEECKLEKWGPDIWQYPLPPE